MHKIQVILGSTRQARNGETVFAWVERHLAQLKDKEVTFEFIDLKDWNLQLLDAAVPPKMGDYADAQTQKWAAKVAEADGYLIVTPEYNHGYPAVLKNALDLVYAEWNNKPVSFVGYGAAAGGVRAVEQLRQVAVELKMLPLSELVDIPLVWEAFDEAGEPKNTYLNERLATTVAQLVAWTKRIKASA